MPARSSQEIQRDLRRMALLERAHRALFLNRLAPRSGPVVRDRRYGEVEPERQCLDLILPRQGKHWPAVLFVHGGGFSSADKASYDRLGKVFAHAGYLFCNIDYRLAPRWKYPAQLEDVADAIRWCWEHLGDFGGDREHLFLAGDSAGAYLAATYAAALGSPRLLREFEFYREGPLKCLCGLLLFYGIYDLATVMETGFPFVGKMARDFLGTDPEGFIHRAGLASPLRHVHPDFPPTFLCSSDLDPLHPQSEEMRKALAAAGVPRQALFLSGREYPNAYHGFLVYWTRRASRLVLREALSWLDRQVSEVQTEQHPGR